MPTFTQQISDSAQDGDYATDTGLWSPNAARQGKAAGVLYSSGFRFTGLTIPAGAVVTSATLRLVKSGSDSAVTVGRLYGDAVNDAAVWSTSSSPTSIAKTTAYTQLSYPATNTTAFDVDITSIVAEIFGRPGWQSGNSIRFGGDPATATGFGRAQDYFSNSTNAATLTINYTEATSDIVATFETGSFALSGGDIDITISSLVAVFGTGSFTLSGGDVIVRLSGGTAPDPADFSPIRLPRLQSTLPIVEEDGAPTQPFQRYFQTIVEQIETAINGIQSALNAAGIAQAAADAAQDAADRALAASGKQRQTVQFTGALTRLLAPDETVDLSAFAGVQAGGTAGTVAVRISGGPSGGAMGLLVTGAVESVGPSEATGATASVTFTNTTGVQQFFDFQAATVRTPSTAGGSIVGGQSYLMAF